MTLHTSHSWKQLIRSWMTGQRFKLRNCHAKRQRPHSLTGYGGGAELLEERTLLSASPFPEFVDPNPSPGNQFGKLVVPLATGNVVISSPFDDAGGTDAGAVYLFNGSTGALISTLTGSTDNDQVGNKVTALSNGNFLVRSRFWDNGAAADAGAVTFGNGTTGVSGAVSAANSLIGSTAGDQVGKGDITELTNGNYVVTNSDWDNGIVIDAGAVTFGNGTTGIVGAVSISNSLIGSSTNDEVGNFDVAALSNGNYVVLSYLWDNGAATNAGAVTFGDGTTGVSGEVSPLNSLVGSTANDIVGAFGITALSNGNYVVNSALWDNGETVDAGAVTFGNGTTGVSGVVGAANSLVGSSASDQVGSEGIVELSNGNYVVSSSDWSNGVGAVTFGDGTTGVSGAVSAANSLVGSTVGDQVGNFGITALNNGNYVVQSVNWSNSAGAVTFGNGTTGISGAVSVSNSLVGSTMDDFVGSGGVAALSNGNYVVSSDFWDNGATTDAGAVTFGNGTTGVSGAVSASNSLVGTSANDEVGSGSLTPLSNGNYVVSSEFWDNGATTDAGAVTFGNGTTGTSGAVSVSNSLVGSTIDDFVGSGGVAALSNGNYVVVSNNWDNDAAAGAGAVTFGNGTTGISGVVSAANSLVGSTAGDQVGLYGVAVLSNGNYVVTSSDWDNVAATDAGAVTFGDGTTGISGAISALNSLVGSTTGDKVGSRREVVALTNGNYVVPSSDWDNGAATDAGAVTFGDGTTGITGAVSALNSLVGSTTGDKLANGDIIGLTNGNYVVSSSIWDNGAATDAGAVTFGDGTMGVSGGVSAANSLVGLTDSTGLNLIVIDDVNDTFYAPFNTEDNGKVRVGSQSTPATPIDDVIAYDGTTGDFSIGESNASAFSFASGPNWDPADGWKLFSGDFNGDGLKDVAGYRTAGPSAGRWQLGLSNGSTLVTSNSLNWNPSAGWTDFQVGDYNGDGKDDVAARTATGQWWMVSGNGTGLNSSYLANWSATGWVETVTGDFNNDGTDDIAGLHESGQWWVGFSNGAHLLTSFAGKWTAQATAGWHNILSGDFNADGKADIAAQTASGRWYFGTSTGAVTGTLPGSQRFSIFVGDLWSTTSGFDDIFVGDFDGDGRDDLASRTTNGQWWVQRSLGNAVVTTYWGSWGTTQNWTAVLGDFNGDGRDDLAGIDATTGNWYVSLSQTTNFQQQFFGTSPLVNDPTFLGSGKLIQDA